jgi:hypothetical protein
MSCRKIGHDQTARAKRGIERPVGVVARHREVAAAPAGDDDLAIGLNGDLLTVIGGISEVGNDDPPGSECGIEVSSGGVERDPGVWRQDESEHCHGNERQAALHARSNRSDHRGSSRSIRRIQADGCRACRDTHQPARRDARMDACDDERGLADLSRTV